MFKKFMVVLIFLLCLRVAAALQDTYMTIDIPEQHGRDTVFDIVWDIEMIDNVDVERWWLVVKYDNTFKLESYDWTEASYVDVNNFDDSEPGELKFDINIVSSDMQLTLKFKSPGTIGMYNFMFEATQDQYIFSDSKIRSIEITKPSTNSDEDLIGKCSYDIVDMCEDGSKIITFKCMGGTYVQTTNTCPEQEVVQENQISTDNLDGSNNNQITNGSPEVFDPNANCALDHEQECWDSSYITTHFCVDGSYVETGKKCPEQVIAKPVEECLDVNCNESKGVVDLNGSNIIEDIKPAKNNPFDNSQTKTEESTENGSLSKRTRNTYLAIILAIIIGGAYYINKHKQEKLGKEISEDEQVLEQLTQQTSYPNQEQYEQDNKLQ